MQRMPAAAAAVIAVVFLFVCLPLPLWAAEAKPAATGPTPAAAPSTDQDDYEDEYDDDSKKVTVADPIEPVNRVIFWFNDKMYFYALKPAAQGVRLVVPIEIRSGVKNMFHNIRFPVRFVNSLLQAKWLKARNEFCQFFLNTTVGFLGFADVASIYPELNTSPEDTGQTFAVWGWESSFYLMLPVFGPSTGRDSVGKVGDILLDPLYWLVPGIPPSVALRAGEAVNDTTFRIGDYEAIKDASLDSYVAIRNGFIQNREKLIGE
jgi:phospholipid-binding lipoprotein MlaA